MLPVMRKVNSEEKKPVLLLRNFRFLYYPGILERLHHLIIQFALYYLLVVAYERLKTKENFKFLALKVVAVAYERCSLTRGSTVCPHPTFRQDWECFRISLPYRFLAYKPGLNLVSTQLPPMFASANVSWFCNCCGRYTLFDVEDLPVPNTTIY